MATFLGPFLGFGGTTATAQITFEEVGAERGIGPYDAGPGFGSGISVADYDDDGDHDLFVANTRDVPDQLYRNLGDGRFEEIAGLVGLATTDASRAALWLDFDADGRLDLVVAGDCYGTGETCAAQDMIRFHRQRADGTFENVTAAMGLDLDYDMDTGAHRAGFAAGDLNADGWPDVVVGLWQGPALVLLNDAGQGFIDASVSSGIETATFHHWQPAIHDFDGDGWSDIYWAADFTQNRFWLNRRDGTFDDVAPALGVDNAMNDMGLVLADYDNDGDFDFYVTEIFEFDNHNVLYRNDTVAGQLAFAEVAEFAGVDNTDFGWGATFLDADNDGWLDLAVTNGWFSGIGFEDQSRFFHNLGTNPVVFDDTSVAVGFDDRLFGSSLVAFDMDRDGDLDLAQTCNGGPVRLLESTPGAEAAKNHHLVVRPRMDGPNTRAIGAVVRLQVGGQQMSRLITAGTSHLGQEPAEAFFGVGDATTVPLLVVAWPDGAQTIRRNVRVDQVLTIDRSSCAGTVDLDGNGVIDFADLLHVLARWGECPGRCPEDINGDGTVNMGDVLALLVAWGPCTA